MIHHSDVLEEPASQRPQRTLLVVLGASRFSDDRYLSAEAFDNTARAFKGYFSKPTTFDVSEDDLLDLFNRPLVVEQLAQINDFLTERLGEPHRDQGVETLVVVLYVGHGGFHGQTDYSLILTDTRRPVEAESSLSASSLGRVIRRASMRCSILVILDCCYAAEAARHFQVAGDIERVRHELAAVSSERRITLLCAAGSRHKTVLEHQQTMTLFGGSLLRVLEVGDPFINGDLSTYQVRDLVLAEIQRRQMQAGDLIELRPEVHSPRQDGGDLATRAIFRNPSKRRRDPVSKPDDEERRVQPDFGSASIDVYDLIAQMDTKIDCRPPAWLGSRRVKKLKSNWSLPPDYKLWAIVRPPWEHHLFGLIAGVVEKAAGSGTEAFFSSAGLHVGRSMGALGSRGWDRKLYSFSELKRARLTSREVTPGDRGQTITVDYLEVDGRLLFRISSRRAWDQFLQRLRVMV